MLFLILIKQLVPILAQADAVVNAGPAVFLSSNGPNPIMVQVIFVPKAC